MNKSYTRMGEKVIVKDNSDNQTITEYFDNIERVLIQQNIIEEIENRIKELKGEKTKEKIFIPTPLIASGVVPVIGAISLNYIIAKATNQTPEQLWPVSSRAMWYLVYHLVPLGMVYSLVNYDDFNQRNRSNNYYVLDFLTKQLNQEKDYLAYLLNNKTYNGDVDCSIEIPIDSTPEIKKIDYYISAIKNMCSDSCRCYIYPSQKTILNKKISNMNQTSSIKL